MSHIYGSVAIHRGIAALKKCESWLLCLPTPNYTRVLNAKSLWQESLVRTLWKDKRLMSKNTASEKRLKTTEQSGNVTTTAIGDRLKKIQQTPKQSGQHSHSQQIQDNRKEAKTVRPTQPQPTDSRQNNKSQNSQDNTSTANRFNHRTEAKTVRTTQPQATDSRQQNRRVGIEIVYGWDGYHRLYGRLSYVQYKMWPIKTNWEIHVKRECAKPSDTV